MQVSRRSTCSSTQVVSSTGNPPDSERRKAIPKGNLKKRSIVLLSIPILLSLAALVAYIVKHATSSGALASLELIPPNPEIPQPPSPSILHRFKKGAVCTDGPPCSAIGNEILRQNGSAVDAAIAALFCNGIITGQSMGLGGGFLMTLYSASEKKAYVLNAREAAPEAAKTGMFTVQKHAQAGPLAVCVPGELRGYWVAHKRFGRLDWADLVKPSIKLCRNGYHMSLHQYHSLSMNQNILQDATLREIFVDPATNEFFRAGTLIKAHRLCDTLQAIADYGGDDLYNGTLSKLLAKDLEEMGSIITLQDLQDYEPKWQEPIDIELRDGFRFFSAPPPGSGALVAFILNILDGYNFNSTSILDIPSTITTFHRIIEAYKYAAGFRTRLGDPNFVDVTKEISMLTNQHYANKIRKQIDDKETGATESYGATFYNPPDAGTAHISVVSPDGDAVSVTSTIDIYFGAGVTSKRTGIILNSGMDDFAWREFPNYFNLPGSPSNAVAPGKRPLSSMSPSIIIERNGNIRMVVGASGGTKIPTAVAYAIIRHLWFGQSIKEAIDAPRIHHQLFPNTLYYEFGVLDQVIKGLEKLHHTTERYRNSRSVICAIARANGTLFANSDFRKGGEVNGD